MGGLVPVFILLDEATIYAFLDVAFDLDDLVLSGGVWTPSHHRAFKLWFEFEVHLDQFFAGQGWGQRSKNLLVFLDELTETGSRFMLSSFSAKSSSAWRLLFSFPASSYAPLS